jgi:PleD family two-component response regulator
MAQNATVLLAEMDSTATQLQSFILERAGFQVITAQGGGDLLRLARQRRVDLILSEVLLPDADGIEICRLLRADWSTRFIPFVLLTSLADPEYRVRGLLAGADDYIAKPFDLSELSVRLYRLIETFSVCYQVHALTRLPSNPLIRAYVESVCLRPDSDPWAFLVLDINHFRAYNQLYGFPAGDMVLSQTADLLREVVHSDQRAPAFVGHNGADDFVVVVPAAQAEAVCQRLIREFDARIPGFYPADHEDPPLHLLVDRQGLVAPVPPLALSIGVVTSDLCQNLSVLELQDAGTTVLARAKAESASAYYMNRPRMVSRPLVAPAH